MAKSVDYYLSLISPWSYLGHQRLIDITQANQADINIYPIDFSLVFPATGGLPLPKRAPSRQAYRMQELQRWRDFLGFELVLEPKFFPTSDKLAAAMIVKLRESDPAGAITLAGACLRACWVEERDISDETTLLEIARKHNLSGEELLDNTSQAQEIITKDSRNAIARGVFGAPSYVFGEHIFWGQDRLDFLERELTNN